MKKKYLIGSKLVKIDIPDVLLNTDNIFIIKGISYFIHQKMFKVEENTLYISLVTIGKDISTDSFIRVVDNLDLS